MNTLHVWANFADNWIRVSANHPCTLESPPTTLQDYFRAFSRWYTDRIQSGYNVISMPEDAGLADRDEPEGVSVVHYYSREEYLEANPEPPNIVIVNRRVRAMERVYIKLRQGQTERDALDIASAEHHQQVIKKEPLMLVQIEDQQYWTTEPVTEAESFLQEAS